MRFKVSDVVLPSGLRVQVEHDSSVKQVAIALVVGAGSADDPVGKEGLAHLAEHLVYRARHLGQINSGDLAPLMGASIDDARTHLDDTVFYALGPTEALEGLISVMGSRLTRPTAGLDEAIVDVERQVVLNERLENGAFGDSGDTEALNLLFQAIYPPGHRYGRPLRGTVLSYGKISAADVVAFTRRHYRPDNATLVVVGDVSPSAVQLALSRFAPLFVAANVPEPVARLKAEVAPAPDPVGPQIQHRLGPVETPWLLVAWALPSDINQQTVVGQLLPVVFGVTGSASRRSVESTSCSIADGTEGAALLCAARLGPGATAEESFSQLMDGTFRARQVTIPHRMVTVSLAHELESPLNRALRRARGTHYTADPAVLNRYFRSFEGVHFDRLRDEVLTRDRARVVFIAPAPAGLPASEAPGSPTRLELGNATAQAPPEQIKAFTHPIGEAHAFTLENGLQVTVVRRTTMPTVSLTLALPDGAPRLFPAGVAAQGFALGAPNNSTHHNNVGVLLFDRLSDEGLYVTALLADGNLRNGLAELRDWVGSQALVNNLLAPETLTRLEQREAGAAERHRRALFARLFPGHPDGHLPTIAERAELSAGTLRAWLATAYAPNQARLVVVGNVAPDEAERAVREWFSSWSRQSAPVLQPPVAPAPDREPVFTAIPTAAQVAVKWLCRSQGASPLDHVELAMLRKTLSRRIHRALREQLGTTYGLVVDLNEYPGAQTVLEVAGAIDSARLPEALTALKRAFDAEITAEETSLARWLVTLEHGGRQTSTSGLANVIATNGVFGRSPAELDGEGGLLLAVKPEALSRRWSACREASTAGLLGDVELARAAWAASGL